METTISDLPTDVLYIISKYLSVDGYWRHASEVVRDYSGLVIASRTMWPLANIVKDEFLKTEIKKSKSRVREALERDVDEGTSKVVPTSLIPYNMRTHYRVPHLMYHSHVKKAFHLSDGDLNRLPFVPMDMKCLQNNPKKMYELPEVRKCALEKFGGRSACEDRHRINMLKSLKCKETKNNNIERRRQLLIDALHERGCDYRESSYIMYAHVYHNHGHVVDVANAISEQIFFAENTEYHNILRINMEYTASVMGYFNIHMESQLAKAMALTHFIDRGGDISLIPDHIWGG